MIRAPRGTLDPPRGGFSTVTDEVEGTMDRALKTASHLALPATLLLFAGCALHDDNDVQLPSEVTNALEMAFNKGDIQACTDLYTDDAEIISDDHNSVVGRKAIGEFFEQQVSPDLLFDTDSQISVVSGNVAMEQGTYKVRNVQTGVDVEFGDYLNVWRKTDGHWKAYRSMYNVTRAPGALVSVQPAVDDRGS
jgi:ketosteroid isomerase-like protein